MKVMLAFKEKMGTDILDDSMLAVVVNTKNQESIEKCILDGFQGADLASEIFQTAKDVGNKNVEIECNKEDGIQFYVDEPTEDDDVPEEMTLEEMLEEVKLVYVFDIEEEWMNDDEEVTGRWAVCTKPEEQDDFIEIEWLDETFEDDGETEEDEIEDKGEGEAEIEKEEAEEMDFTNLDEKKISKGYQKMICEESKPTKKFKRK